MRRLWILFKTEFSVWKHDPITALGGFIPCLFIFLAFTLLFGGRMSFKIAVLNNDRGEYGQILVDTFEKVISPLDNAPYYAVQKMDEAQAWKAFNEYRIEGIWLIPEDFSTRIAAGDHPEIDMYFMNYNDDRAKNHRMYSSEVLWQFYQTIGQPAPPLARAETYPLPVMIDWVSIISIGIVLLSVTLGSIFNMFILTYKAQTGKITLEMGLSPHSLGWVLFPKAVLALLFGLATGTLLLVIIGLLAGWIFMGCLPVGRPGGCLLDPGGIDHRAAVSKLYARCRWIGFRRHDNFLYRGRAFHGADQYGFCPLDRLAVPEYLCRGSASRPDTVQYLAGGLLAGIGEADHTCRCGGTDRECFYGSQIAETGIKASALE
jgi:hypothetical protein